MQGGPTALAPRAGPASSGREPPAEADIYSRHAPIHLGIVWLQSFGRRRVRHCDAQPPVLGAVPGRMVPAIELGELGRRDRPVVVAPVEHLERDEFRLDNLSC